MAVKVVPFESIPQPLGTLKIQVPLTTTWGGKLVTVMRVTDVPEHVANDMFEEYKTINPGLSLSGMWETRRVTFY